jgi:hypothetical protein
LLRDEVAASSGFSLHAGVVALVYFAYSGADSGVYSAGAQCVTLGYIAAFIVLMRRPHGDHDGFLRIYWWPVIAVAGFFATFTIAQASTGVFMLLGTLLVFGTGLYFIARRDQVSAPEPIFD